MRTEALELRRLVVVVVVAVFVAAFRLLEEDLYRLSRSGYASLKPRVTNTPATKAMVRAAVL